MSPCTCGKEVRLGAFRLRVNRRQGVGHYIEHMDGTKVCPEGEWTSAALKPYPKDETQREYAKLKSRWESVADRRETRR